MFVLLFLFLFPAPSLIAQQEAELNAKVGNFVAYFTHDKKIRHERWEFSAKQTASFGIRLKTVVEGRLWWDMALMNNDAAARREYTESVREDELFEGEARNIYADYLGDWLHIKIGRQIVDWTASQSPALFDMLTAVDLRHGVSYAATDLIIPVNALSVTHDLIFDGSLEWLVIPEGQHHRLAKGDNGYGYYSYLKRQVEPRALIIKDAEIPKEQKEVEYGLRYQTTLSRVDFTLLGFHGHQRSPSFMVEPAATSVTVKQYYPQVNTFGTSLAYAQDAWVARVLAFYEPKRPMRLMTVKDNFDNDEIYDRRYLAGIGFDWVFSNHLKIYTEQYGRRTETVVPDHPTDEEDALAGAEDNYTLMVRATNETFDSFLVSVESVFTSPDRSRIITPSLELAFWEDYKLTLGARFFSSSHPDSQFESLKDSSHYFARLETKINVGKAASEAKED